MALRLPSTVLLYGKQFYTFDVCALQACHGVLRGLITLNACDFLPYCVQLYGGVYSTLKRGLVLAVSLFLSKA